MTTVGLSEWQVRERIARQLRANAKDIKNAFKGDRSEWARAMRRNAQWLAEIADLIDEGRIDDIRSVGK